MEAKNILFDKKTNISIFQNEVVVTTEDNNIIKSDYAEYNKNEGFLKLTNNIIAKDNKGNIIKANYAEYYDKILDFAGLDKSKHKNKGELFNPEKSINNIGMWRDASGELAQAISFIEDKLPEYLYTS